MITPIVLSLYLIKTSSSLETTENSGIWGHCRNYDWAVTVSRSDYFWNDYYFLGTIYGLVLVLFHNCFCILQAGWFWCRSLSWNLLYAAQFNEKPGVHRNLIHNVYCITGREYSVSWEKRVLSSEHRTMFTNFSLPPKTFSVNFF